MRYSFTSWMPMSVLAILAACGGESDDKALVFEVSESDFVFSIAAKGELNSADEIPISAPMGNRGTLTLAWMEEENKKVKKGDVVARFDGTDHELKKERSELNLKKNELSKNMTIRDLDQKQFVVGQQVREVSQELAMVEKFSVEDLAVYSRLEIIDQLLVKDYLGAHQYFLGWREESQQHHGEAQVELLNLEGKTHRDAIELSRDALGNLEVLAPADGVLIHAKNWRGQKIREGQSLWPGSKLASIPSLDNLLAKLYVFEIEAAGIASGQRVELRLDAYPDRPIRGNVIAIANIAAPRSKSNPSKYFEVTAAIEGSDPGFMRPGQKLEGKIYVAEKSSSLNIPNQSVFKGEDGTWVYREHAGRFEKIKVKTGLRSLTKTEILEGLRVGDRIALLEPPENAKR